MQCNGFFPEVVPLVILACNTSSAKALRTIQQQDLVESGTPNRVLGVIRPTTEIAGTSIKNRTGRVFWRPAEPSIQNHMCWK